MSGYQGKLTDRQTDRQRSFHRTLWLCGSSIQKFHVHVEHEKTVLKSENFISPLKEGFLLFRSPQNNRKRLNTIHLFVAL